MVKVSKLGLFVGEYIHNLTDRNRIALPKRIRIEIDGFEVVLSKGAESCIEGFDKNQWREIVKNQLNIPFHEETGRKLRRRLFSSAMIVELDSQGRVVLPDVLLSWAKLKGKIGEEIYIVGVGDHFEIWEKSQWLENKK